ncbi:MAG: 30S ribosomal protein S14 [Holosporaceae bacterium]|jgi:small subunit ribosomal protein S14|nr:30S ribosomal protein S14 [Holosporaceae bacterium]
MARQGSIEKTGRIRRIVSANKGRRGVLKGIVYNRTLPPEDRFAAQLKLAAMPRNSSATRIRNRCIITGRSRGVYRKFNLSRIMIREMVADGLIPGMRKACW